MTRHTCDWGNRTVKVYVKKFGCDRNSLTPKHTGTTSKIRVCLINTSLQQLGLVLVLLRDELTKEAAEMKNSRANASLTSFYTEIPCAAYWQGNVKQQQATITNIYFFPLSSRIFLLSRAWGFDPQRYLILFREADIAANMSKAFRTNGNTN